MPALKSAGVPALKEKVHARRWPKTQSTLAAGRKQSRRSPLADAKMRHLTDRVKNNADMQRNCTGQRRASTLFSVSGERRLCFRPAASVNFFLSAGTPALLSAGTTALRKEVECYLADTFQLRRACTFLSLHF